LVAPVPPALAPEPAAAPPLEPALAPPVTSVSYSSLGEYARCGYRFYAQRVLGLPELSDERGVPMRSGDATAVERSGAVGDGDGSAGRGGAEGGGPGHSPPQGPGFRLPLTPRPEAIVAAAQRAGLAPPSAQEADALTAL